MSSYIPLHMHTHFSVMDGIATPEEYVVRAKELGMSAISCTDHGTLSAHRRFHEACTAAGVKPILGAELYYTDDRFDRRDRGDRKEPLDLIYNHLIALAVDDQGLQNLRAMMELAWTEGFFHKPRVDWELLDKYGDGLIISSACMSGIINKALEHGDMKAAKQAVARFEKRFQDDFYIEVMPHNPPAINHALITLADSMSIPLIVTPDCHHATTDQKVIQEIMLLLNTHAKPKPGVKYSGDSDVMTYFDRLYGEDRKMTFRNFDIHLLSGDELWEAMGEFARQDMFDNTLRIADQIQPYTMPSGLDLLPVEYANPNTRLKKYAFDGLRAMGLDTHEYRERLDHELKIIANKRFSSYFLMVRNITNYAHRQGILMSPGRGSAAGSLVAYVLQITNVDPVKHHLLFERFIDPERSDFPDADLDFEDTKRDQIKEFIAKKYGYVATVATFNKFGDKGTVRDVSRILNVPLSDVNAALKQIDTWDDYVTSKHHSVVTFREKYPDVQWIGEQLHGRVRNTGLHAAGVVACKVPLNTVAPIETRAVPGKDERLTIVAIDKDEAEAIGLVKMDILGLKTLTVVKDTLTLIRERHNVDIDLDSIFVGHEVWDMLNKGMTKGVFQVDAGPFTNLVMTMGVHSLEELSVANALVRPGAANTIGKEYIARKQGKKSVHYIHKSMRPYLEDTLGTIIYQEQVMQACVTLGGMTMAEANKVRRIIGKKKDPQELEKFRSNFVRHASTMISVDAAERLWHDIEAHAGYSFNKSHALAYATLAMQTAWLKYHYPVEFFCATLSNEKDMSKVPEYMIEAKRMGIPIHYPHVNKSGISWTIEDDGLRMGLSNIKYISDLTAQRLIDARPFESYSDLEEFVKTKGSGVNSRALDSMFRVGAANFEDKEVVSKEIEDSAYEFLGVPSFNANIPNHWYSKLNHAEEYMEGDTVVVYGYVKSMKSGKGWTLYDILDSTGTIKCFGSPRVMMETGKSYVLVIADKTVIAAVDLNGESTPTTEAVTRYLDGPVGEGYVLAATSRTTKAGQRMGTVVFTNGGPLVSATLFASNFPQLAPRIKIGKENHLVYGPTKNGGYALNEIR